MKIGVPTEILPREYRVAVTPGTVLALTAAGHDVVVQAGAGLGSGFTDDEYRAAGAVVSDSAADAWAQELVLKVKEPAPQEYAYLRSDLTLFTYLHLAAHPVLTEILLQSGTTALAYETVQLDSGALPLLTPMSEVAGRMSVQVGAHYLSRFLGGRGVLLGGVPGTPKGRVVILGGGMVGMNAAKMAMGLGAMVTILDVSLARLQHLDDLFSGRIHTLVSNIGNIEQAVLEADLLIGAVLIPGARAPRLVSRELVSRMKPGSVIVDVAVDQGGCVETIHPTTHDDPTFIVDEVVHYGVSNMPGAVPNTSTIALSSQTLPYVLKLARGPLQALAADPVLRRGLQTFQGKLTYEGVASALGLPFTPAAEALGVAA
jgi:alanine dehydrogenase